MGHGLLDCQAADRETVLPPSIHDVFAGAVVTRRRVPAAIVCHLSPAPMAASGDALQQRRALSHCASRLVWLRPGVGVEPRLIGLKDSPIHRKMPNAFLEGAGFIDADSNAAAVIGMLGVRGQDILAPLIEYLTRNACLFSIQTPFR